MPQGLVLRVGRAPALSPTKRRMHGPSVPRVKVIAPMFSITTDEEYEAAAQRVGELTGCMEGTPEEAELEMLIDAMISWDRAHDDVSNWQVKPPRP